MERIIKKTLILILLTFAILTGCTLDASQLSPVPDPREIPPPLVIHRDGNPFDINTISDFQLQIGEIPLPLTPNDYYYLNPSRRPPSPKYY